MFQIGSIFLDVSKICKKRRIKYLMLDVSGELLVMSYELWFDCVSF